MKVEILIREVPYFFEDFIREQKMEPYIPEDALADIPFWTKGPGGTIFSKVEFDGEPCYRAQGENIDSLIKLGVTQLIVLFSSVL